MNKINKRSLIAEYAKGQRFLDLGGLWGTHGEMVSSAVNGDAASVAIADIMEPGTEWWQKMDTHLAGLGIAGYGKYIVDIRSRASVDKLVGKFDFVHCSGIMYHVTDVFEFIENLLAITDRYLLVGSVVVPAEVLGIEGALCAGAATEDQIERVSEWLDREGLVAGGITLKWDYVDPSTFRPNWEPWWWLFTPGFMSRVIDAFNVQVVVEGYYMDNAYMILIEKRS